MTIKIGKLELATKKPADLADQVLAATGLGLNEVEGHLSGQPIASRVAQLLKPWLAAEAPEIAALATVIAEHGIDLVAAEVRKLFAKADEQPAPTGKAS